jgi:hypothetical protein
VTVVISFTSWFIAVSGSWTHVLATPVAPCTQSSIHFSFSSLLNKSISSLFTTSSFFLDVKLRNAPNGRTQSTSKPLVMSFASSCWGVAFLVDLPYWPSGSYKKFSLGPLTIVLCVDLVVRQDVGCYQIWTTWRQAESWMARFVCLINSNKPTTGFWPSFELEL